ncbi:tRNA (guanosine(37)-N1)-methyltransferase TrmD, partial [Patescibacteria group bacterium]|nr:tRNA (guanosine(37)-N1)-methyltransferase TrmD [Patescibacteria group bacterium]
MRFDVITIFPEIFNSYFNESIIKRARKKKKINIKIHDLRKYTSDKHKTVDDRPYGGGPGMVLKIEPLYKCLKAIKKKSARGGSATGGKSKTILLSAKGKTFNQTLASHYKNLDQLILICGHYEGVDERIKKYIDQEISIGNYVLTGGEVPAMVIVDSITRLIPGVLGDKNSPKDETFSKSKYYIEYPHYTRPENFKGQKVPEVLLSGNHSKIANWRQKQS